MSGFHAYLAQRISALILAPCVALHLGLMIYAVQGGVSAAEILGRTEGSLIWALFYGIFVLAVAVHAAIGLGSIAEEWFGASARAAQALAGAIGLGAAGLGLYAVWGVTFGVGP